MVDPCREDPADVVLTPAKTHLDQNEFEAAVLVVDFWESTRRQFEASSLKMAFSHVLFHNVVAMAESLSKTRRPLIKFTGDGCIFTFCYRHGGFQDDAKEQNSKEANPPNVTLFGGERAACLAAGNLAVEFCCQVVKITEKLQGRGFATKCAVDLGKVFLIDYRELYQSARACSASKRFVKKIKGSFEVIEHDPHGLPVNCCYRILGSCKENQIIATVDFCNVATNPAGAGANLLFDVSAREPTRIPAKGFRNDEILVKGLFSMREGLEEQEIKVTPDVRPERAVPQLDILKKADQCLDRLLVSAEEEYPRVDSLLEKLERKDAPARIEAGQMDSEKAGMWKFLETLFWPSAVNPSRWLSDSLNQKLADWGQGQIVFGLEELMLDTGYNKMGTYVKHLRTAKPAYEAVKNWFADNWLKRFRENSTTRDRLECEFKDSEWSKAEYHDPVSKVRALTAELLNTNIQRSLCTDIDTAILDILDIQRPRGGG